MENNQDEKLHLQRRIHFLEKQIEETNLDKAIGMEQLDVASKSLLNATQIQESARKELRETTSIIYQATEELHHMNEKMQKAFQRSRKYLLESDDESLSQESDDEDIKVTQPPIYIEDEPIVNNSMSQGTGDVTQSSTNAQDYSKVVAALSVSGITGLFYTIIAKGYNICDSSRVSPSSLLPKFDNTKVFVGIAASIVTGAVTYMLKGSNPVQEPKL